MSLPRALVLPLLSVLLLFPFSLLAQFDVYEQLQRITLDGEPEQAQAIRDSLKTARPSDPRLALYDARQDIAHQQRKRGLTALDSLLNAGVLQRPEDLVLAHLSRSMLVELLSEEALAQALEDARMLLDQTQDALGWAYYYQRRGQLAMDKRELNAALDDFSESLGWFAKVPDAHPIDVANQHQRLSRVHAQLHDGTQSVFHARRSLALREEVRGANHPSTQSIIETLGTAYFQQGQYERAGEYYQRARDILLAQGKTPSTSLLLNSALVQFSLSNWEAGIPLAQGAVTGMKASGHSYLDYALNYLGVAYRELKDYPEAERYLLEALRLREEKYASAADRLADSYNTLGAFYLETEQVERGRDYLKRSVELTTQAYGAGHPNISKFTDRLANSYRETGDYAKAWSHHRSSLQNLGYEPGADNDLNRFLSSNLLQGRLRNALATTRLALLYGGDVEVASFHDALLADLLDYLHRYRANQLNLRSRENLLGKLTTAADIAIQTHLFRGEKEAAFQASEMARGYDVLEGAAWAPKGRGYGVPASLRAREDSLNTQLVALSRSLADAPSDSLRTAHFATKRDYYQLLDSLRTHFPRYYEAKFERPPIEPKQVAGLLATKQTLLEYFVADSAVYVFALRSTGELQVERRPRPADFSALVTQYYRALASGAAADADAQRLTDILLPASLLAEATRLVVVPHDLLHFVPFETLPHPTTGERLLRSHAIGYASSAAEVVRLQKRPQQPGGLAIFAPTYPDADPGATEIAMVETLLRDRGAALPGARQEATTLHDMLAGSTLFVGATLDRQTFLERAPDYGILHLSMHALATDDDLGTAGLLFPDSFGIPRPTLLTELDHLNLKAELVVLSACETGYGTLRRGQGPASIHRAFVRAGAAGTVFSLWKVPDDATATLMTNFYQNLLDGQSRDVALQHAKLSYLDEMLAPEALHPRYWSGFLVHGRTTAIDGRLKGSQPYGLWLGAGVLGLFLVAWLTFYRRRASSDEKHAHSV